MGNEAHSQHSNQQLAPCWPARPKQPAGRPARRQVLTCTQLCAQRSVGSCQGEPPPRLERRGVWGNGRGHEARSELDPDAAALGARRPQGRRQVLYPQGRAHTPRVPRGVFAPAPGGRAAAAAAARTPAGIAGRLHTTAAARPPACGGAPCRSHPAAPAWSERAGLVQPRPGPAAARRAGHVVGSTCPSQRAAAGPAATSHGWTGSATAPSRAGSSVPIYSAQRLCEAGPSTAAAHPRCCGGAPCSSQPVAPAWTSGQPACSPRPSPAAARCSARRAEAATSTRCSRPGREPRAAPAAASESQRRGGQRVRTPGAAAAQRQLCGLWLPGVAA